MRIDAIKEKVPIIKTSEEAENDCVLELHDEEFDWIQITTSLRNALLSTNSIENGFVRPQTQDKEQAQTEDLTLEEHDKQSKTDLPIQAQSKISFKTLRETIKKVLGRGER